MPFQGKFNFGELNKTFEEVDNVVVSDVLPELIWINPSIPQVYILPNYRKTILGSHRDLTNEQDPRRYFALSCRENGLSDKETELWLDTCFERFVVEHTDGVTREISAGSERIFRLDRRKLIYYFGGVPKSSLYIRERS